MKNTTAILMGYGLLAFALNGCDNQSVSEKPGGMENSTTVGGIQLVRKFEKQPTSLQNKFVDLSPTDSGIDYQHVWDPPPIFQSLIVGTFGNGVAIGDFDSDGWQDVFIGRQHEAGRLYKNLSGMRFKDVTREVGINPQGMWCVGTTFVDINNDGMLDLYLCGYECPNRLYINEGGSFRECAKDYGLDFKGSSIVMNFADYDRDGDLDGYLVTNFKKLQNKKSSKRQIIQQPGQPPKVAPEYRETFFLVKHPDGKYRRSKAGQFDYFFRNDGGTFVEATEDVGIGLQPYIGLSSAWWDYNDDGWPDLYVANDFKGPEFLYRNNGPDESGKVTFTDVSAKSLPHTPWYSMGSDFADVDNDGRLDFLASDMAGTNHYRDKLSMGSMSGPDSNGWFLNAVDPPQYMRNALYLNTGCERFAEVAYLCGLAKTDWTWTVKFSDFDNDGWQDVFFTNGMTRDLFNSDLKNEIDRKVRQAQAEGKKKVGQMVMDFWKQQPPFRLENLAFCNRGDYKFENVGAQWGLDHLGVSMAAAVGDLDNDGDLDLVVNGFEEQVKVYRNELSEDKSIRFRLVGNTSNRFGLGARIDIFYTVNGTSQTQTRYVSPTRGFMSTCESIVHFGVGQCEKIDKVSVAWPSGIRQSFADLTSDCLYQVTEASGSQRDDETRQASSPMFEESSQVMKSLIHKEIEFNDFKRQPLLPNKHSQLGPGLAWGDIDGDGIDELFMGGARGFPGQIMRLAKAGRMEPVSMLAFEADRDCEDMGALFADFDTDGDLDLYVVSGGVECDPGDATLQDRIYLNEGGRLEKSNGWLPEYRDSGSAVAAVDFDRDGDTDLVVGGRVIPGRYPEAPRSRLLVNEGGSFTDRTEELAEQLMSCGMVNGLIWSDVDQDQWPDLLVATEWGPIHFFKNDNGKLLQQTEAAGLSQNLGWFNSICGGDVDNDGDTDFVVGNIGLNTKYKATVEKPELLYYGDFEGVGRKRIVEAKYEADTCLPRRGLSCSSHAMPMIKEKTPTYHEFAISSLDALYTQERLSQATRYQANTLESLVLVNETSNGEIQFRIAKLPRLAQASPIYGCQLIDVNADGVLDLYTVQNFYGPQRETGYFDGGLSLLMMGDGNGGFDPVNTNASGLLVPGDATSLTCVDLDHNGSPDFIVGKNNASPQCFLSQTDGKKFKTMNVQKWFSANGDVFGTSLLASYSDGTQQRFEIQSSQGYLSQSTSKLFIGRGQAGRTLTEVEIQFLDGRKRILTGDQLDQ